MTFVMSYTLSYFGVPIQGWLSVSDCVAFLDKGYDKLVHTTYVLRPDKCHVRHLTNFTGLNTELSDNVTTKSAVEPPLALPEIYLT